MQPFLAGIVRSHRWICCHTRLDPSSKHLDMTADLEVDARDKRCLQETTKELDMLRALTPTTAAFMAEAPIASTPAPATMSLSPGPNHLQAKGGVPGQGAKVSQAGNQRTVGQGKAAKGPSVGKAEPKQGLWRYMAATPRMEAAGSQAGVQGRVEPRPVGREVGGGPGARRGRVLRRQDPPQHGGDAPSSPRIPALHKQDRLRICGVSTNGCTTKPRT